MTPAPMTASRAAPARRKKTVAALAVVLAALALLAVAAPAHAAPIITVLSTTVTSPGSGSFDVSISIPPGDPSINLESFTLDIDVPAASGITFTGVTFPSNYVFAGNSFDQDFSLPFGFVTATHGHADDSADVGFPTLNAGDTFNLAEFSFTAAPGLSPGTMIPVTIDTTLTSLSDPNASPIPYSTVNGTITVTGSAGPAVPEPATIALFGMGFAGLAAFRRWRGKRVAT